MAKEHKKQAKKSITDDEIFKTIYYAIIENRIAPGERLGQDELGRIFGVSKTRIRPILRQLSQKKLVEIIQRRGAFVAKPSIEDAINVNRARQIIEEGIVRTLIRQRLTTEQVEYLREIVDEEQEALRDNNFAHAHHLTGRFHIALAECTGNVVIANVIEDLISQDSLAVALYQQAGMIGFSIAGHSEILNYISSGDEKGAVQELQKNLNNIVASLILSEEKGVPKSLREALEVSAKG